MTKTVFYTYFTPRDLIDAYTNKYKELKNKLGMSVIAKTFNDYNIIGNVKVEDAKELFEDSELLFPFLSTKRGLNFLKTREGYNYLMKTKQGGKYRRIYGYEPKCTDDGPEPGLFSRFPISVEEEDIDYRGFQKLWC